ncbi:hypothetical protein Vadar_033903 [Vaccinium darrowii]|uniref:Uncharacterized protein n=1 Tax=Vaccinium darrowii TaxID=229202 RepID=A0ACB7YSS0_9ERIC|nr:hypothetical protein Vadar_033903 [Vaccinium darrowii]
MAVPASMESIPGSESTPGSSTNTTVRASTSKRRGPTRGINTERLIAANGGKKLVVEIPREVGVPVGDNATRFASWVGVQVRVGAPLKEVEKWSDIPSAIKAPILQATRCKDKFDVKDYEDEEHVVLAVNRKCQTLYKNWRHKMKKRYLQLVKAGKNPYNTPYRGVKHEDWAWMIDNIWTNNDKEDQLEANPQEVEVPGSTATTQQEMTVEVDGKKWYLKDYGVSAKQPSKRSTGPSRGEVQVLKNQLETLTQDRQRQDDEMVTLKDLCQRQQEKLSEYDEKFETNSKLIDAQAKKIEQFEAIMSALYAVWAKILSVSNLCAYVVTGT